MPDSYYRSCRTCGRRIQMRKMPQGQWVAFEGYENQHRCQQPPANPRPLWVGSPPARPTAPARTTSEPGFADIELPDDLDFGEPAGLSAAPQRPPARRRAQLVAPSRRSARQPTPYATPPPTSSSETAMTTGQKWVVAIIIVVALIVAYNVWLRPRPRSLLDERHHEAALVATPDLRPMRACFELGQRHDATTCRRASVHLLRARSGTRREGELRHADGQRT